MSALSSRFPTPLPLDPWWDVFLPARMGEGVFVDHAVDDILAVDPTGDTLAICARALFARFDGPRAERLAAASLELGGFEADRLAISLAPDGLDRAPLLAAATRGLGLRAEIWCDVAARSLLEGDLPGARDAVDRARAALHEHAETQRWMRFLREAADPRACFEQATRVRTAQPEAAPMRDAMALVAHRKNGFVCAERWQRRSPTDPPTPTGSALARLRAAGIPRARLFPERALARRDRLDPATDLELMLDGAQSLVLEGRPARERMRAVLAEARRFTPAVQAQATRLACSLSLRDPALGASALDAAERLLAHDPGVWTPWVALLGRQINPSRSIRYARTLLADPSTEAGAFLMAHDTLRLCGEAEQANALALRALAWPGLRSAAQVALQAKPGDPPHRVSGG